MKLLRFQSLGLWSICCFAFVVRLAIVLIFSEQLENDVDAYLAHAENLVIGNGFSKPGTNIPTAFRAPLLPWMYASVLWCGGTTVGIGCLQAVVGTCTVWFTGKIGETLGIPQTGKWAALIMAIAPLSLFATASLMTETLFSFFVVWILYAVCKLKDDSKSNCWRCLGIGFLFGFAALCRPIIWAVGACWGLYWLVKKWRVPFQRADLICSLLLLCGVSVVVFPWGLRNYLTLNHPVFMTTHGGYTLLLGNNEVFHQEVVLKSWGTTWEQESLENWQQENELKMIADLGADHIATEVERDQWMNEKAIQWISSSPRKFLEASFVRFGRFWGVTPQRVPSRFAFLKWGVTVFYLLLFFFALVGLFRFVCDPKGVNQTQVMMLLLVLSLTLVHLVYWSNMRMRTPLDPCLAIWAAGAFLGKSRKSPAGKSKT